MSAQSALANVHPITRIAPAPAPSDPVPAMRREMKLLRIELERFQAMQKFLLAQIDCLMANRDQWQREAERLSDLLAQAPGSTHEADFVKPHWWLFWWRRSKSPCEVP